jgi:hypothetical protein
MTLNSLRFALFAGLALLTVSGRAETKLSLKSVSVDLPAGDQVFPEGAGWDLANNNPTAKPLVLSGTWWVNSGSDFDPDNTVPVPAGSFVKRAARTPHYDGVKAGAKEPAVIGIFGIAPVAMELAEADKPPWRKV